MFCCISLAYPIECGPNENNDIIVFAQGRGGGPHLKRLGMLINSLMDIDEGFLSNVVCS